jgi:hypothetical protein
MQNAKDSFYIALRNRLAEVNPSRVVDIRAVQRPGILVEDAEPPQPQVANDLFVLRWTGTSVDTQLPSILAQMTCEIHYASSGSQGSNGLDRGRALSEMDEELLAILTPAQTQKLNYTQTPAVTMQSLVFWSEPTFGATDTQRDQLTRVAKVMVFAFQEQGD